MKNLKTFESWGMSNYPPGAEKDPNAPWNQKDEDFARGYEMNPKDVKFETVYFDQGGLAILKHKPDGKIYAMYFDPQGEEMKDYLVVQREYIGKDEDGFPDYEYDWETAELDEFGVESYATEQALEKGLGRDLNDFEDEKVSLITPEVAAYIIPDVENRILNLERSGKHTQFTHKEEYNKALSAKKILDDIILEK